MKKFIPILAVAVFVFAIWSSFSSAFAAIHQGRYGAVMRGNDITYHSTGKCTAGNCKLKTKGMAGQSHPAAPKP
jgi:type 1 fimbria pilin